MDLSQITVGGRNLILNSQLLTIKTTANAYATVEIVPYDSKTNMWHITAPQGGSINAGLYFSQSGNVVAPIAYGKKWVFSFDVKGTGVYSQNGIEWSENYNGPAGQVYSDWTRISSTGTSKGNVKAVTMYFNTSNSPLDVYIKLPKLEIGNVATDWTPAPEDTISATTRGQILDGYDLNGYTDIYKYTINGANNLVNYPSGASTYASLEVERINDNTTIQILTDTNNHIFVRTLGGNPSVWSAWSKVGSTVSTTTQVDVTYLDNFGNYGATSANQLRSYRNGNMVFVTGLMKNTADIAFGSASSEVGVFQLSNGYKPVQDVYAVCHGSGQNIWLLHISATGLATIQRYGTNTQVTTLSSGAWLPVSLTFVTADVNP
jgi:hypothetical protein